MLFDEVCLCWKDRRKDGVGGRLPVFLKKRNLKNFKLQSTDFLIVTNNGPQIDGGLHRC